MADIATLGLSVESGPVEQGAKSLGRLTAAAKNAEAAARSLGTNTRGAAAAAASVAPTAQRAAAALDEQASAANRAAAGMRNASAAANDNVRRMGGSFSGLAAQVQDIGVTAAMGMNPMIIALQQGTQIAGQMETALQNGGSAATVLGQAFRSLLSPVSLVAIGLTGVLAAGLQMVNWASVAAGLLNGIAAALEPIAPYAVAAAGALALLYSTSIITGIGNVVFAIGRVTEAVVLMGKAFILANPLTAFVFALGLAAAAAIAFRDEIKQLVGRDIVGDMKNAGNLIIGVFVGAYNYAVSVWQNLPDALRGIAKQAVNSMIEVFESPWLTVNGKTLIPGFDLSGAKLTPSKAEQDAIAAAQGSFKGAMGVDYLGNIGEGIAGAASGASSLLQNWASGLGGAGEEDKAAKKLQEQMALRLENLRTSLMTERELELATYQERLADIQEFENARKLTEDEARHLRTAAEQQYRDKMVELDQEAAAKRLAVFSGYTSAFSSILDSLGSIIGTEGKKQFEITKKLSMASAVIKGLEAVVSSYAAGAKIGGPPLGMAFAAAAAATTAAQIAQISRQQYQGGGSVTAAGGGAGAGSGGAVSPSANQGATRPPQQAVYVTLNGTTFGREQVADLIRQINDLQADNGPKFVFAKSA